MSSTQKWRSYGGLTHFESNNSVSLNNLTVGNLSVKNDYVGYFGILGPIYVDENANIQGNVRIGGSANITGSANIAGLCNFTNDAIVGGNLTINKSITINGQINIGSGFVFDNDINVNGNVGMAGKYIYIGPKNIFSNYGKLVCNTLRNEKFMGVNQPIEIEKILPGAGMEIYCDTSNNGSMNVFNGYSNSLRPIQNIPLCNSNYQGMVLYSDVSKSSIYMFNEHYIPFRTNVDSITGYT